jgi:predicted transcriptional regulator
MTHLINLTEAKSVTYDTDLKTIVQRMMDENVLSLDVTRDGAVIGKVTHYDLFRVLIELLDQPEKHGMFESAEEWLYEAPVAQLVNTLAQTGI